MQIAWLVSLCAKPIAAYDASSRNDITASLIFATGCWAAAICLSILYVIVAVAVAYLSSERLPYFAISMLMAAVVIVGILLLIGIFGSAPT